jgi:Nucleotidyl transferase AbiEii toxin, Type IV TA system
VPRRFEPQHVLPPRLSRALGKDPYWFVIGGHAVRCFCPYRPSDDVDFGVSRAKDLADLLRALEAKGKVKLLERTADTVHLSFDGTDVSILVLPVLRPHTEGHALTATGILATKLHAILDRGTRRDFFDLYVMMDQERLGIIDCLRALREVYATDVNEGLLLRAITYFEDADAEAPLAGEGKKDWAVVQAFFKRAAGALLAPPGTPLEIERRVVGVAKGAAPRRSRKARAFRGGQS